MHFYIFLKYDKIKGRVLEGGEDMNAKRREDMKKLASHLELGDKVQLELLSQALIHPSYAMENHGYDNQRLEFLGDAVVDLVIGNYLYQNYPTDSEGQLTKMRATLVCEASLAAAGERMNLGEYLLLGRGEANSGGSKRRSNLADALEALCGAIYLSCGVQPLMSILVSYLGPEMEMVRNGYYGDYKTRLQEYVQQIPGQQIEYVLCEEIGPSHDKRFRTEVLINGITHGSGWGQTKKESEREAALQALIVLGEAKVTDVTGTNDADDQ